MRNTLRSTTEATSDQVIRRSIAPVVESLEVRRMFSFNTPTITADIDGHVKLIIESKNSGSSSSKNETLNITEDPENGTTTVSGSGGLFVVYNDPSVFDDVNGFEIIEIRMRDGNDTVNYNVVSDYEGQSRSYIFDMGEGDDDVNFTCRDILAGGVIMAPFQEGVAPSVIERGRGSEIDIEFDCDGGNDDVNMNVDDVRSSRLVVEGGGEGSSDDFVINIDDVGDLFYDRALTTSSLEDCFEAAVVDIDIDLGSGSLDTIRTSLDDVGVGSEVNYNLKGNTGNDNMWLVYTGDIQGSLIVNVTLDAGNDKLEIQLNGDPSEYSGFNVGLELEKKPEVNVSSEISLPFSSEARFNLQGNDGNDTMSVTAGTRGGLVPVDVLGGKNEGNVLVAENAVFDLREVGGYGDDKITTDFHKYAGLELEGKMIYRQDGDHGKDTLTTKLDISCWSDGDLEAYMRGGNDNDKLYLVLNDYSHSVTNVAGVKTLSPIQIGYGITYGSAGYFLQDGGTQTDTAFTQFNGLILGPGDPSYTPIRRRNMESILINDPF